ncbi:MAG: DUF2299 family protein [Lutibacter sp.]
MNEPTMLDATSDLVSMDVCTKIKKWLVDEDWNITEIQAEDIRWGLHCEDQFKRKMNVIQRNNRPDQVLIIGGVILVDSMKRKMERMDIKKQQEFRWLINIELLKTNLEFQMVGTPLEKIDLSQRLYYDALTKDEFIQRVSCLRRGIILILALLQRQFNEIPEETKLGFQLN